MNKVVVLTPLKEVDAFRLAGVTQFVCRSEEAVAALQEVLELEDLAMVIVDERLMSEELDELLHHLDSRWKGVITVLPAPADEEAEEDFVARLIKRAIGYHVRLTG